MSSTTNKPTPAPGTSTAGNGKPAPVPTDADADAATKDKDTGASVKNPTSSSAKSDIDRFIRSVDKALPDKKKNSTVMSSSTVLEKKALVCRDLFEDAMKLSKNPGFGRAFSHLQKKALAIPSKAVREELAKVGLQSDVETALAIVVLDISQSVNSVALEVLRRNHHGSADNDIFKGSMDRLTTKTVSNLQLRGQFVEMKITVPDDPADFERHWTKALFDLAPNVAQFRSLEWPKIRTILDGANPKVLIPDKEKIERVYTGELGLQEDSEYIPAIRKEMRKNKLGLDVAHKFESKKKTAVKDLTPDDIDAFDAVDPDDLKGGSAPKTKRSSLNSIKNRIRSAVSVAKTESRARPTPPTRSFGGTRVSGGGEAGGGDDPYDSNDYVGMDGGGGGELGDPGMTSGGDGATPPTAEDEEMQRQKKLQDLEERQAKAKAMMEEEKGKANEAMQAAEDLRNREDLAFAEENKQRLNEEVDKLKGTVQASDKFNNVGNNFRGQADLINELVSGSLNLSSTGGVIQSYESNEELVASVSGGKALHGLSILMDEYPVTSGGVPLLKTPEYVEMYGVTQPFVTSTYKTTQESEMSSFEKTASSGGMSMAESTSESKSASVSGNYGGGSGSVSGAISSGSKNDKSSSFENSENRERNVKTSTAVMIEYIKMPMKCFRMPYDSMRLSEDAKRAIRNVSTERQATQFLITFGSHLPFGMHTLGGVFFRKITMQTESEVSSVSLFAAAGDTMSEEKSSGKTASVSAGYQGVGFGVAGSASASESSKSGSSSFNANSSGEGSKDANTNSFYTLNVSSLGPNATTAEDFAAAVSQNTGTWAIIDRGELDQVIPVWDLIQDEMLDGSNPSNKISLDPIENYATKVSSNVKGVDEFNVKDDDEETDPSNKISLDPINEGEEAEAEKFVYERAVRLMKRVWAQRAELFMDSPSAPNLPTAITRNIEDYVAVNKAIGQMVQCICSVIIPIIDDGISETAKGNRVAMLRSLKEVVGEAINSYLGKVTFEFGNWWIEQFIKDGMEKLKLVPGKRVKLDYKDFKVETNTGNIDSSDQQTSSFLRQVHARAAEAAKDLTVDAWEQLYDEFVPLAKLVNIRNFKSSDDLQRITKVWHVSNRSGSRQISSLQTSTGSVQIGSMESATFYCADAVTPIRVRAVPPSVYDKTWNWWEWRAANRRIVRLLNPGTTYFWLRDTSEIPVEIDVYCIRDMRRLQLSMMPMFTMRERVLLYGFWEL